MRYPFLLVCTFFFLAQATPVHALEPVDVYIVANKKVAGSLEIAEHYCVKRGVPKDHILGLDLPEGEDISRRDYDQLLVKPLRDALKDRREKARVLLTVYGVPLRVGRSEPSADEKAEAAKLNPLIEEHQKQLREMNEEITGLESEGKEDPPGAVAATLKQRRTERQTLQGVLTPLERRRHFVTHAESEACVDSELSMLWFDAYELRRWHLNLLYFQVTDAMREGKPSIVMVARLDGPSVAITKRLVDDAVAVEKKGLEGKAYFDARGIKFDRANDTGHGYGGYDESLREAAKLLQGAKMDVTLDDKPELFKPGTCPDCALYCGWYSRANYVDCCKFVPGSVAYHIASSEAVSLRNAKSKLWCKSMLEDGVCATLGPVAEPYTIGFPKPAEFFGFLVTGKYTLVESYYKTSLFTSWMTVLVGDPLYNPYMKNPKLKPEEVKPSPVGGMFGVR